MDWKPRIVTNVQTPDHLISQQITSEASRGSASSSPLATSLSTEFHEFKGKSEGCSQTIYFLGHRGNVKRSFSWGYLFL